MQFKVPQFIDVEDKIFGPFTFRQFMYLIGGAGMIYVIYKFLPLWIGIFLMIPVAGLAVLLTFYKINNKPFIYYLQAAINYGVGSKLYVWKQRLVKHGDASSHRTSDTASEIPDKISVVPMMSSSKLKDLSWSLDIENRE
ncbi:MAG: PrgI family protein [Patescibacteria group bacterium]